MCSKYAGKDWRLILEVDGRVVSSDEMVRTAAGWVRPRPVFCRNGHQLRCGGVLVGFLHCPTMADRGHGHLSYRCMVCGDIIVLPLPTAACDHERRDGRPTPKLDGRPRGTGPGSAASE